MQKWLEEVQENGNPNMVITLIGNKCDREEERAVSREEGEQFAKKNGLLFFETSAVNSTNVDKVQIFFIIYKIEWLLKNNNVIIFLIGFYKHNRNYIWQDQAK